MSANNDQNSDLNNGSLGASTQQNLQPDHATIPTNDDIDNDEKKQLEYSNTDCIANESKTALASSSSLSEFFRNKNQIEVQENDNEEDESNNDTSTQNCPSDADTSMSQSQIAKKLMYEYVDKLPIEDSEKTGILNLYESVLTDELFPKVANELCVGDIVLSYFSSLSKNNPDPIGCWKRWALHFVESPLKDLDKNRIREYFETGVYTVGYDNEGRPVWFVNLQYYDIEFGPEIIAKCTMIWLSSLLWDLSKDTYDYDGLKKGLSVYCDMAHWSLNLVSWNITKACKSALVAFPFQLEDIYLANTPAFIYFLKQIASKAFIPHAMEKFRLLNNANEYIEKYAPKEKTPAWAGGIDETTAIEWLQKRGYLKD